jgi:ATP-dependent Clp protease adapter protein ClpS
VKTEVKQKQKQKQMQKAKTGGPVSKRKEEFEDAPMYKVMLLEDDSYDSEHVITRMCAVMEDMDEDQAATVFEQAMKTGKVRVRVAPLCLSLEWVSTPFFFFFSSTLSH